MQNQLTKSTTDSQGQRIKLIPTNNPSICRVELDLGFKKVYPGVLDFSGEGCFRVMKKPRQIHEKLNSWGVNAELIERYTFKWVSIICEGREYITTTAFLRRFGKRLIFKNFEPQYLLPVRMWGLDVVKEFEGKEARKPQQLSIFQAA